MKLYNERRWKHTPPPDPYEGLNPVEQIQMLCKRSELYIHTTFTSLVYRANDPCAYCGWPADTWDHIDAKARGGHGRSSGNLVRACGECNRKKGTLTLLEFLFYKDKNNYYARKNKLKAFCWMLTNLLRMKTER